ncbi:Uncharacterised protein, partial [Mycoplasma putrefaciens]
MQKNKPTNKQLKTTTVNDNTETVALNRSEKLTDQQLNQSLETTVSKPKDYLHLNKLKMLYMW